jgi:hypothetical protein
MRTILAARPVAAQDHPGKDNAVTFVPYDRPVRAAFIGLGRIYDLNARAYAGKRTGDGPLSWSGEEAVDVLRFALAAYASSASGGIGVNPGQLAGA